MPPPTPSLAPSCFPLLLLHLLLCGGALGYEAPEEEEDVFARRACPAFLSFQNAAYMTGVTVELPCSCKPKQVQEVVWFYRRRLDVAEDTRALSDHHGNKLLDRSKVPHSRDLRSRFTIRLFSLLLFRAGPQDSGIYLCGSSHGEYFYAYDLDIQKARKITIAPSSAQGGQVGGARRRRRHQARHAGSPAFQLFTVFQDWLPCDRCGVAGEQVRAGLCYVHSHYLHVRFRRANVTAVSCGSGAVPVAFDVSSKAGAQVQVRGCHGACPPEVPPPAKLQLLMDFLGYSSSGEKPSGLTIFYLNHPSGHPLALGCPGAKANMAVAWDRRSAPIYRVTHLTGLGGNPQRISIDTGNHLVFSPAKISDTGVYYCWLQGRRTAEVRLLVYAHLGKLSVTDHPDFKLALRTVLISYAAITVVFILLQIGRMLLRHVRNTKQNVD